VLGHRRFGDAAGATQPTAVPVSGDALPGATCAYELRSREAYPHVAWILRGTSPGPGDLGTMLPACAGRTTWAGPDPVVADFGFVSASSALRFQLQLPADPAVPGATIVHTALVLRAGQPCPFDPATAVATHVH
jgi:hypothetical protein